MTPQGLALVKRFEGCKLDAYLDIAGVLTIGYGHTANVFTGERWTQAEAEAALNAELNTFREKVILLAVTIGTEFQIDAMTALAYNIGINAFASSSVIRLHNAGNFRSAADAFLLWDKAHVDGALVVVQGLLKRRSAERSLYLAGTA